MPCYRRRKTLPTNEEIDAATRQLVSAGFRVSGFDDSNPDLKKSVTSKRALMPKPKLMSVGRISASLP